MEGKLMARALIISLGIVLGAASGALGQLCDGDSNGDGRTTIAELVRAVRTSLEGCADEPGQLSVTFATDKLRYKVGDSLTATLRLFSSEIAQWWDIALIRRREIPCFYTIAISRYRIGGKELVEEVVYESERPPFCDTSGGALRGELTAQPLLEFATEIPLLGNTGEFNGVRLGSGTYRVESHFLLIGLRRQNGADPYTPPIRSSTHIEILPE
jgi:hypothetical protein